MTTPVLMGNRRKAAVALVALGPDRAAAVLRGLEESEVKALATEVMNLGPVTPDEVRSTMAELARGLGNPTVLPAPGKRFAKDLLVRALGPERGELACAELDVPPPFGWLEGADPDAAAKALASEPAGAVALALAHLTPKTAAKLLVRLPEGDRARVAGRIAGLGSVHPDTVAHVEAGLRARVQDVLRSQVRKVEGPALLAGVLAKAGRDASRELLQVLAESDPALAEATSNALFTFEDACGLDAKSMQVLLRSVDGKELAVALSTADEGTKNNVLVNMSERARETLVDEMDLLRGLKASEVNDARNAVVATARRLEEEGQLVLSRGDDEDDA
ncbi:MAG: flagellar motor switch protein FliG [Frankiales bacterium]|nr:flagellar motor switch protein FliG [Frankiales bacterium]